MILLDTNVLSELMSPKPSPAVLGWMSKQRFADVLYISTVTLGEILYGIELLPAGKRRDGLWHEAEAMFQEDFGARILPFDDAAARFFAKIAAARRMRGRPISNPDAQIAATARVHGAALATRNTADFEGCGLTLINPWNE
jgi:predicted nucleic acid-binding protein